MEDQSNLIAASSDQADLLFISDNFPPVTGGSATVYHQLCQHNSDKVVALTSRYTYLSVEKKNADTYDRGCGFRIYRRDFLRAAQRSGHGLGIFSRMLSLTDEIKLMLQIMVQVALICRRHNIKSICVGELIYGSWLVLFAKFILRKPVAIYTHGEEISQESNAFFARMRGRFLKEANVIFSVSQFCTSQIVSIFGIVPAKIILVRNGVDLNKFTPKEKCPSLIQALGLKDKKIVLAAGRHVERKGFDYLIICFRSVIEAVPDAHLLIIGDGALTPSLKQMVKDNNLEKHIDFLGRVDDADLVKFYQLADIFTMPNRTMEDGDTEGFGLVFLEANACGKAVVGGIGGGTIEAVINGKTGISIDATDPRNIADAIVSLLGDEELRKRMGRRGRDHARAASWETRARDFRAAVARLCETRNESGSAISFQSARTAAAEVVDGEKLRPSLLVTVDFEESFDWADTSRSQKSLSGLKEIKLFHEKCRTRCIKPTYLLTYDTLRFGEAADFLTTAVNDNECDVGIHLHSWNTPPFFEQPNEFNTFQCNLPKHLEEAKLENLVQLFEQVFDRPPITHRAGRYGINEASFDTLASLGIKLDLSPMSDFDFTRMGGPSFRGLANQPFWTGPDHSIFCLPLPSERFFKGPDWVSNVVHRFLGQGLRIPDKQIRSLWRRPVRLTPEGNTLDRMKIITETLLSSGQHEIVLSLHSTSLHLGGNPYSTTQEEVDATFNNFEKFVDWCQERYQMTSASPTTVLTRYERPLIGQNRRDEGEFV